MEQMHEIYLGAFRDRRVWTIEDHDAGLQAVFLAGADAARRQFRSTERERS